MDGVQLSSDEIREIEEASASDKKMGLDKPKKGSIIPKGPGFQKVSVKCMSCGKGFEVDLALYFSRGESIWLDEPDRLSGESMEIYDSEYAGLRLKTQHPLEVCLVLPSGTVDHQCPLVVTNEVAVDMPCNETIGNDWNHQSILWFWGKGGLATP